MKVYVDQGVDQNKLKQLAKDYDLELMQGHRIESRIKNATQIGEPFILNISKLGGMDRLVDNNFKEIEKIIGKDNYADIIHLYSAYMENGCQYFITNNPRDFIRAIRKDSTSTAKRDELEKILTGLRIVTLDEFSDGLRKC